MKIWIVLVILLVSLNSHLICKSNAQTVVVAEKQVQKLSDIENKLQIDSTLLSDLENFNTNKKDSVSYNNIIEKPNYNFWKTIREWYIYVFYIALLIFIYYQARYKN